MAREHDQARLVGTKKFYPAIADLQGIEDFVRVYDITVASGSPERVDLYTVPTDKIYIHQLLGGTCAQATPTALQGMMRKATTDYTFANMAYGAAWALVLDVTVLMLNEGEILRATWQGPAAGNSVYTWLMGYLVAKY